MSEILLRRCLLEPPPVFENAAQYLEVAAEAMLDSRMRDAAVALVLADIQEIMVHTIKVVGPISYSVHRNTTLPKNLAKELRAPGRMPSAKIQDSIFERDRWCCRFCGTKVICKKARAVLTKAFPIEVHWGGKEYAQHAALYALESSIDHILPHSRGGSNDSENLVTSCYCCQRRRWFGIFSLRYIGKTTRKLARERIKNHLIKKDKRTGAKLQEVMSHVKAGGKVKVSWVKIEPESLRNYVEEELILRHGEADWNRENRPSR